MIKVFYKISINLSLLEMKNTYKIYRFYELKATEILATISP